MAIRVYKPTTAGRRNASVSDFSELTRSTPEKSLVRKLSKTGGRNSYGRMTSRHRGGGHKRQYRLIDFKGIGAKWHDCNQVGTIIHVAIDGKYAGHIVINDTLKGGSAHAIREQTNLSYIGALCWLYERHLWLNAFNGICMGKYGSRCLISKKWSNW